MAGTGGLIIVCGAWRRAGKIQNRIEASDAFTTVISMSTVSITGPEIVLVSFDGEKMDYIGLAKPGRRVTTDEKTISVTHLVPLGVQTADIRRSIPSALRSRLDAAEGVRRIPPATWRSVLRAIAAKQPHAKKTIKLLRQRIDYLRKLRRQGAGEIELFERDAVACALETFGGRPFRKEILRSAQPPRARGTAPFLSRLGDSPIREDPQVIHDQAAFPGMEVVRRHQVGAVVLQRDGELLTVINCNRQPLEHTLGVDLIYYHHRYDSFVMVQYKRMSEHGERKENYRPLNDKSHQEELERMAQIDAELSQQATQSAGGLRDYRLMSRPFFFKLCRGRLSHALDEGMVPGMYFPLELWRRTLHASDTKGTRGGINLNWDNCPRRLSNSEFTSLLRQGWIGSAMGESAKLTGIIEAVLSAKRMLVYAATSASPESRDYTRDEFGRFASEDDPLASR